MLLVHLSQLQLFALKPSHRLNSFHPRDILTFQKVSQPWESCPISLGRQLRYAYQISTVQMTLVGYLSILLSEGMGFNSFCCYNILDMF